MTTPSQMLPAYPRRRQEFADSARSILNAHQALAFMFMLDVAPLSSSAFAEFTGASQSSALFDLTDMVKQGVVQRVGQGRNTRYRIAPGLRRELEATEADKETAE